MTANIDSFMFYGSYGLGCSFHPLEPLSGVEWTEGLGEDGTRRALEDILAKRSIIATNYSHILVRNRRTDTQRLYGVDIKPAITEI